MSQAKDQKGHTKRTPIVTIVGHVDHGKTSLLEALLKTNLTTKEVGGITQAVSAHRLIHNGREITFVDTPGHEAFLAMRRRGGRLADIVLLVVAGTEGVKPQTKEAINQIKESQAYPIVVITKMDLPEANPEKVKRELSEAGILVEGLGGQVPVCETSIKDRASLNKLLDLIFLVTDLHDFPGSATGDLEAVVLESFLDRRRGPLALVVVRGGALKIGDEVYAGKIFGKIRTLIDDQGQNVTQCPAGQACYLMGLPQMVDSGAAVGRGVATPTETVSPKAALGVARSSAGSQIEKLGLKIVLRADTFGSLEAIEQSLKGLKSTSSAENELLIVSAGVGDITDNDVYTALESGAAIIGFRVRAYPSAVTVARDRGVEIKTYEIIYQLLDELSQALSGLAAWQKKAAGPLARILKIFVLGSGDQVLGIKVDSGTFKVGANVVVRRNEADVAQPSAEEKELLKSSIKQLRLGKQRVEKVGPAMECGLLLKDRFEENYLKVGDTIATI